MSGKKEDEIKRFVKEKEFSFVETRDAPDMILSMTPDDEFEAELLLVPVKVVVLRNWEIESINPGPVVFGRQAEKVRIGKLKRYKHHLKHMGVRKRSEAIQVRAENEFVVQQYAEALSTLSTLAFDIDRSAEEEEKSSKELDDRFSSITDEIDSLIGGSGA
ncbi:MAG: hypothetical protein CSA47_01600 [Gammaproteobacteria bacterium]|nr:MAG: hypothetical protein CSA47_01600 [Gammaproteobacteria bacterium]